MSWVRIEDAFFRHRKVAPLSAPAKLLFLAGLCRSVEQMADGFLDHHAVRIAAAEVNVKTTAAKELVDAGLWHKSDDGYEIHDYLVYQPSAQEERERRAALSAKRSEAGRKGARARWQNGEVAIAHRMANAIANEQQTDSPNPNPLVLKSSSSSPLLANSPEDDDEIEREAHRRLAAVEAAKGQRVDRAGWLATTIANLHAEGWTPSPQPTAPPPCDHCHSTGWTIQPDGDATPCATCNPRSDT